MSAALLVQIALKVSIILMLAGLATRVMRRSSAAARHFVWTIAILGSLLVPALVVVGPTWSVSVLPELTAPVTRGAAQPDHPLAARAESVDGVALGGPAEGVQRSNGTLQYDGRGGEPDASRLSGSSVRGEADSPAGPQALPESRMSKVASWMRANWQPLLLGIWAAGVVFVLFRLGTGIVWVGWVARRAEPITDMTWLAILEDVAATLRLRRQVSLRRSDRTTVPVACGLWRPILLMPIDADDWSAERRRVVLLHELAHVKRQDCRLQALAQIVLAGHWFNPLAHLAVIGLRAEQERACDDLVLAAGTEGPVYADHLFEIARACSFAALPRWATLAMATPSQLEGRVLAILDARQRRQVPSRFIRIVVAMLAAAAVLPLGAFRLSAAAPGALPVPQSAIADNDDQVADVDIQAPDEPALVPPLAATVNEPLTDAGQGDKAVLVAQNFNWNPANPWPDGLQLDLPFDFEPPYVDVDPNVDFDFDFDFDFDVDVNLESLPNVKGRVGLPGAPQGARDGVPDETRQRVADALSAALSDENERVREQAIQGLAAMQDPRAVPALIKALQSRDARLRRVAVGSLSRFDTPEAAQGLIGALKDEDVSVRRQAVSALGRRRDPKYTDVLAGAMRDQDPQVRAQAVAALARVRDSGAVVPALVQALKDSNAHVRARAAASLASLRSAEAVPGLIAALKDADADVRRMAAVALGAIADPRAVDALTAALKDMDPAVREHAARALGHIARGQRRGPGRIPVAKMQQEIERAQKEIRRAYQDLDKTRGVAAMESLDPREMVDAAMRQADEALRESEKGWHQLEQLDQWHQWRPAPWGR